MKEQPPLDAKCRDKFLVQSVAMPNDEDSSNLTAFWQSIEKTNKAAIQERKIRVNFLSESSGGPTVNGTTPAPADDPPAYSSPSPQFGSPAPQSNHNTSPQNSTTLESARSSVMKAAEVTGVAGAATVVANAVPTSSEDLKAQLVAANAQITKLKNQIADPQVRQRKVQEASEKMQTIVAQTNEGGVPLQICAGLCLLSFLIAYLFF